MKNKPYGITGSICSGKTTCTEYLINRGYQVIDADKISHKITNIGEKGYIELVKNFGDEILKEDRKLNRKKLSSIVFSDENKLNLINSIIHPIVKSEINKEIDILQKREKIFFLDIPLLLELNLEYLCEKVILIYVDEKTQMERLIKRDNIDKSHAQKIISSQMTLEEKKNRSDILIENSSTIESLYEKINKLIIKLERKESD